jgi:ABC-type nitrate/sulfonate/bicarbonate transport system permease component
MTVLKDTKLGGFSLIAAFLLLWEILARAEAVAAVSFPPFSEVFVTFWRLTFTGTMVVLLLPSLKRLLIGYLLAFGLGVGLGILMGYFRTAYNFFEPITELLRPIPSPAYIPIAILFFGLGDEMKIFMIAFAAFFPILLNTYSGVRSVDLIQINTARTFGLGAGAILRKVIIPASSPQILTGMRISVAVSLILVVISEMVASVDGIGYYILSAQRSFRVREMYAGVLTLGLLGYVLNWLFLKFENSVIHWHLEAMKREQL